METPNYRKASIYFDDETVLEVTQRGGGGSGVGGETGLEAVNLITGESTNAALAAKDETIAEQAATIEQLQEELADVPTIEALSVTANGTYSESGKAYSPVNVNVAGTPIKNLKLSYGVNLNVGDYPAVVPIGDIRSELNNFLKIVNSADSGNQYIFITPNTRSITILLPNGYKYNYFSATSALTNAGGSVSFTPNTALAVINLPAGVFDALTDFDQVASYQIASA